MLNTLANYVGVDRSTPPPRHAGVYSLPHTTLTLETLGLIKALRNVDVFAPNKTEALHLTGATAVSDALAKLAAIVPTAVIKLGSKGAIAQRGSDVVAVPPIPITLVDTTGAGDCFNAGFVYGLLQNTSVADCLRYGNIVGGLATTNIGGTAVPAAPPDLQIYYPNLPQTVTS